MMKELAEKKLAELKADFEKGNQLLSQKQQEVSNLMSTLVRIQGAVAVLEDLLKEKAEEIIG
jgi:hypothetical protein